MIFTIKAGDKMVRWEDGFVDDESVYDWLETANSFMWHPEGPEVFPAIFDDLNAFMTIWYYLGTTTGVAPEAADIGAEALWFEATDDGDDD